MKISYGETDIRVGDKVRIKSLEWYLGNRDKYGQIIFKYHYGKGMYVFGKTQAQYCGKVFRVIRKKGINNPIFFLSSYDGYYIADVLEKVPNDTPLSKDIGLSGLMEYRIRDAYSSEIKQCEYERSHTGQRRSYHSRSSNHTSALAKDEGVDTTNGKNGKYERVFKTYLMKDENTGYTKIGKSINPQQRERTLQSEKPTIKLFKVCEELVEKELHCKFYKKRIRGEWFDLTKRDIEWICQNYRFS